MWASVGVCVCRSVGAWVWASVWASLWVRVCACAVVGVCEGVWLWVSAWCTGACVCWSGCGFFGLRIIVALFNKQAPARDINLQAFVWLRSVPIRVHSRLTQVSM